MNVLKGFLHLVAGLGIAGKHLGRHAVTLQYPEQKDVIPERSRGQVVLLSDKETGELNCTACQLCQRACPTGAIYIEAPRDENKKKYLKVFNLDNALCCYCGLCEEACNFVAIKMAGMYEFSDPDKGTMFWDKDKLQAMGRDVPYEDTRKKKADPAADKPAAGAKPAEVKAAPAAPAEPKAEAKPAGADDKPTGQEGQAR